VISRRTFLGANLASLMASRAPSPSLGANPSSPGTASLPDLSTRDYWNDWPTYFTHRVTAARDRRKSELANLHTSEQLNQRIATVRSRLWEIIGGPAERTPLNPTVVGKVERKEYFIDKVIFESQPEVYVTAHLYVPRHGATQQTFPGIVAPLGHVPEGKRYRNYQYAYQTLARMGYVVLAYDPFGQGERLQYLDSQSGKTTLGPTAQHSQAGRPLVLLGASFSLYRIWDGIRALDYLLTRPEVDPSRIGCTGHSGGGTMTMYLVALDPRIKVAVEVQGNSENLGGPLYTPPGAIADAEQNILLGMRYGIDRGDLLMAFAPKPLLMCYTPHDSGSTYSPALEDATHEILGELQHAYAALGARDRIGLFTSPLPHDLDFFSRRALYDWFNRWFGVSPASADESEFQSPEPEILNCTATGQVLTSLGGRSLTQLNVDRMRLLTSDRRARLTSDPHGEHARIRQHLRDLLALPDERARPEAKILSSNVRQGAVIEEIVFRSEAEIRIPGWLVKPAGTSRALPSVLYVSDKGKNRIVSEPAYLEELVQNGNILCAIDLRGLGSASPALPHSGPEFYRNQDLDQDYAWAGLMLGLPVLGQRVTDILACVDYLSKRADVDAGRLRMVGEGRAAIAALMASVIDDRVKSVLFDRLLASYECLIESSEYTVPLSWFLYGALTRFDLSDLVGALSPRSCWLLNATGPTELPLPESEVKKWYGSAYDVYRRSGRQDVFRISVESEKAIPRTILAWAQATMSS
jgi:cephalosporin-C deacetylase-like acetyl esterase